MEDQFTRDLEKFEAGKKYGLNHVEFEINHLLDEIEDQIKILNLPDKATLPIQAQKKILLTLLEKLELKRTDKNHGLGALFG
jgi:hypothetical protein